MPVIAIANEKGGVGKTTTAVTIASGLAQKDYEVLIIDLDSQGNVADSLGLPAGNDLYKLLMPGQSERLSGLVVPTGRKGLDVIRSDKSTGVLKISISGVNFREYALVNAIKDNPYDVVVIDCAPSLDVLHTAALIASDYLIIPTSLSQLSIKGVSDTLDTLNAIRGYGKDTCQLLGVLPTFYERVTRETSSQLDHLAESIGELVYPPIPTDTNCREATRHKKTLWEFAPTTRALTGVTMSKTESLGGYIQVLDRLMEEIA